MSVRGTQKCSECGEFGHNKLFHVKKDTKVCAVCKEDLPIGNFRTHTRPDRNKVYILTVCNDCDKKRCFDRYRQDVHCRMGYLFAAARGRAKEKGFPLDITVEWLENLYIQQQGKCFYSGLELSLESGNHSISLDRKDPMKGYTQDNVVLACWMINNMKRDFSEQEFLNICHRVITHMTG